MKKLLLIVLFVPFFFACEKEDDGESIVVTVNNDPVIQEQFRIDQITLLEAGDDFFRNGGYVSVYIRKINNDFIGNNLFFSSEGTPRTEKTFFTANRSIWRIFVYRDDIDESPSYMAEIKPWEHKNSDATFTIPVEFGDGSSKAKLNIEGEIIEVEL